MNKPILTKNQYFGMYLVKGDEIFSDDRILPDKYDKLYFDSFVMMNFTSHDEQMININIPHERGIAQRACRMEYCKLVLIPMDEMTEEDYYEHQSKQAVFTDKYSDGELFLETIESIEWLIKNKYDCFNLIEKGWAIKK